MCNYKHHNYPDSYKLSYILCILLVSILDRNCLQLNIW